MCLIHLILLAFLFLIQLLYKNIILGSGGEGFVHFVKVIANKFTVFRSNKNVV